MAFPLSPLPDDELALIQYLRGVPEVTALVPGARITTDLPPSPVYPVVLIARAGGSTVTWGLDEPAYQVDVVGGTKDECKALVQTVRAAILAIADDVVDEATLVSATEEMGPTWLPDTLPVVPLPRYVSRFRVLLHQ